MPYQLWLAAAPRAAGLKVSEVAGWQTRGRGFNFNPEGIICHHTVSNPPKNAPTLHTVTHGRKAAPRAPALAGPLSQYVLGRDGTVYVVAAGTANHAGSGKWRHLSGGADGNTRTIGIEAENNGVGEPWSSAMIDAYVRLCACLLDHMQAPTIMCFGHKEWTRRKIDPHGIDMTEFRKAIDAVRNGGIVRAPIPKQDARKRPTLRQGARGSDVEEVQRVVGVTVDGQYGAHTEAAVRAWQRAHGLAVADGITGPATWAAIDATKAAA